MSIKEPLIFFTLVFGLFIVGAFSSYDAQLSDGSISEDYPDRTVEVLVGYGAGGGTDLSARNMVEALNQEGIVDQSFFVENMPGAGGALALRELNDSDEYTIEAVPEFAEGLWNETADLDLEDFNPIAQVAQDYHIIAVPENSPYDTIEDLLDAIKADPETITISLGTNIVGMEAWGWQKTFDAYGIEDRPNMVPQDGSNEALTNVLAGDADATFVVPQLAESHIDEGNIKALAVMTDERTEQFPDIPTLKEVGIDVTYYRPRGFWLNGDVNEEYVDYWEKVLKEMVKSETWQDYVEEAGLLPEFKDREDYKELIREDGEAYRDFYEQVQEEGF
ncbi:tripartite tricarboxylate transporter substrate binding protein [Salicibibacter kimchii]|nr:tripartite tricarboxylate transporter substrate binding protein [Salicibibacter kimchii]